MLELMKTLCASLLVASVAVGCGGDDDGDDTTGDDDDDSDLAPLDCDIAIVGAGAAGTYAAYKLTPEMGESVCLFEKEDTLGGRIRDVSMDGDLMGENRIGTGARRVMENQQLLFDLGEELGLEFEMPEQGTDLISSRGMFSYSKDDFLPLYPGIMGPLDDDPDTDRETELYNELMDGTARSHIGMYPDFRSYIRGELGEEAFSFLRDMSRFRADFDYPLSAHNYMEYFDEEWDTCCTPSYPRGGMSSFIFAMEERIVAAGGRIFKSEPVLEIRRDDSGYRMATTAHDVTVKRLIIAAPPTGFDHVTGDIAEEIQARDEYKALIPVRVTVINQWWPEDWWSQIENPDREEGEAQTWRAFTNEHCVNFIEIPLEPYAHEQMVTRSVYNDDLYCTQLWEELFDSGGIDAVEEEVMVGLEFLFNSGVSAPASVDIPSPLKTEMQVWPGAWYFVRAGVTLTNAEIAEWSRTPIPGEENVSLIGEAYWPSRSGWSHGAYRSANALLADKFDIDVPEEE